MFDNDAPLSATLSPLIKHFGGNFQRALDDVSDAELRFVQLSAAQPGMRPRELDGRARKDLIAALHRSGLMISGVDLFVPQRDWLDNQKIDRVVASVLASIAFAADIGRVPLCLSFPYRSIAKDVLDSVLTAADSHGVTLAIHGESDPQEFDLWLECHDENFIRAAIDPATVLATDHDLNAMTAGLAGRLTVARLDDYAERSVTDTGGRCNVGDGSLDVTSYRVALSLATRLRHIVVELRDLDNASHALRQAKARWDSSNPFSG